MNPSKFKNIYFYEKRPISIFFQRNGARKLNKDLL